MMQYKDEIYHELEIVLSRAGPEQIKRLLKDIAQGHFSETAQTRAGDNDNRANVTDMVHPKTSTRIRHRAKSPSPITGMHDVRYFS